LSPFQLFTGRTGRAENPPPQFAHTLFSTLSTHDLQKVHSKVQIIASVDSGGSALLQFSQVGLSSSMVSSAPVNEWGHSAIVDFPARVVIEGGF
jgi:hypothetical protein